MTYLKLPEESDSTRWRLIYCNCHDREETPEDIARAITTDFYIGQFNPKDYTALGPKFEDTDNMFMLKDIYGYTNIWEIGGYATDMVDAAIPHAYKVRRVGMVFDY